MVRRAGNQPRVSKQDYGTPPIFMRAIEQKFGKIQHDLAAHSRNTKCDSYFSLERGENSMSLPWELGILNWLNPPYSSRQESPYSLTHWSKKCRLENERDVEILFLVPAAVGSNWFRDNVFGCSDVYLVNGRIPFDEAESGITVDLILAHYHLRDSYQIRVWDWKNDLLYGF